MAAAISFDVNCVLHHVACHGGQVVCRRDLAVKALQHMEMSLLTTSRVGSGGVGDLRHSGTNDIRLSPKPVNGATGLDSKTLTDDTSQPPTPPMSHVTVLQQGSAAESVGTSQVEFDILAVPHSGSVAVPHSGSVGSRPGGMYANPQFLAAGVVSTNSQGLSAQGQSGSVFKAAVGGLSYLVVAVDAGCYRCSGGAELS